MLSRNRQIHLVTRPAGMPSEGDFALASGEVPNLEEGEVLVRTTYLSVDPYMRGRIGGRPSVHPPFPLHQPANGDGAGEVLLSNHSDFKPGDHVAGYLEWADYSVHCGSKLLKFDAQEVSPPSHLSVLGMSAMTAYFGLLDLGNPQAGETVVISGAAGAVGMLVGQIAKLKGCRVVGIAGGNEKGQYLLKSLGFDAVVDYKASNWIEQLHSACPTGVDLYFDNVGGSITDEVMQLINRHARIVLSGQISSYNQEKPEVGPRIFRQLIVKSATIRGFLVIPDYQHRYPEGRAQLQEWLLAGKIKPCYSIMEGLENVPKAFLGLFTGANLGKQLVKVS